MLKQPEKSKITKEIYRSGKERVRYLQGLIGNPQPDTLNSSLTQQDWDRFRQVIGALRDSFAFDRSEDYKSVVNMICEWSLAASEEEFRKQCSQENQPVYFALKLGLDCLRTVFYRDLRRLTLEPEQSRQYNAFCDYARSLPKTPQQPSTADSKSPVGRRN